jgi:hypothetical protein
MGLAALGERVVDGLTGALYATRERAVEGEHIYLSGLFKPCAEEPAPTPLAVASGALPSKLSGLCVRWRAVTQARNHAASMLAHV